MRKQGAFALGFCLLLLASGACPAADPKAKEPRYKGKPLSVWLTALEDKDPKVRVQAVQAMQSFGPRPRLPSRF